MWIIVARGADQFCRRVYRILVVVEHADHLVVRIQAGHEPELLRRDTCRTLVGVALERLDAAQRKHHRARSVADVSAERDVPHDREAREHAPAIHVMRMSRLVGSFIEGVSQVIVLSREFFSPGADDLDVISDACADQHVVRDCKAVNHRKPNRVRKLRRCRSGATLRAVDCNEVRLDPCERRICVVF